MPRVFGSVMHASDDQDQGYFDTAKVFISCLSNQLSPVTDRWLLWQRDTRYTLYRPTSWRYTCCMVMHYIYILHACCFLHYYYYYYCRCFILSYPQLITLRVIQKLLLFAFALTLCCCVGYDVLRRCIWHGTTAWQWVCDVLLCFVIITVRECKCYNTVLLPLPLHILFFCCACVHCATRVHMTIVLHRMRLYDWLWRLHVALLG